MTLLTKLRSPVLTVGLRNLHKTASLNSVDPPGWDEKKFLQELAPWNDYCPRYHFGQLPDPHPKLKEDYDEPHGEALIPVWWAFLILGIIPVSIYGWYEEYNHLIAHRHRQPAKKYDFLHGEGYRTKFAWGDGKHTLMHHPYWNFMKEGYETDKDGNMLPPGVYSDE